MLNFRKLLHDFSQNVVKEGKRLLEADRVSQTQVVKITGDVLKLTYQVEGAFQHAYHGHLDINIKGSEILYSDCDCSKKYDCEHIAAACHHLEMHYDQILADYAKDHAGSSPKQKRDSTDQKVEKALKAARENVAKKASQIVLQETLQEYRHAQKVLSESAFFDDPHPDEQQFAEALIVLYPGSSNELFCEFQLVLRIDSRAKPLQVGALREFFEALEFEEPQTIAARQHWLTYASFSEHQQKLLRFLATHYQEAEGKERSQKTFRMSLEALGYLLALGRERALAEKKPWMNSEEPIFSVSLDGFYYETIDHPVKLSPTLAHFSANLHKMQLEEVKLMMDMQFLLSDKKIALSEVTLLAARHPGLLHEDKYYAFDPMIQRRHLKALHALHDLVIPAPLIGTLLEMGLPEFKKICPMTECKNMSDCITLPCQNPKANCAITYTNGKMEVDVSFCYDNVCVPAVNSRLSLEEILSFVKEDAILARDVWYEKNLLQLMFSDFQCDEAKGVFIARSDRAIVDFMTRLVPMLRERVDFACPSNLLEQFVYDTTKIEIFAKATAQVHQYELELKVKGPLEGISLSQIWECLSSDRPYFELSEKSARVLGKNARPKVLVLDLKHMRQVARFMDDLGLEQFVSKTYTKPLWTLAHIDLDHLKELPFEVSIDQELREVQAQLWGQSSLKPQPVPKDIAANLRTYQLDGVHWLERLRYMHLAGILADDMGLGKTLQAIVAISQFVKTTPGYVSLVICPTSLVYNWKEEVAKFNPKLTLKVVDGTPQQRKKIIENLQGADLAVTSYSLLQKDIESYHAIKLGYVILDEAQHIKNRQTQNAKCVRELNSLYRLAMTGTPVENSLDELWSLFDFLMPGLMSSYERFVDRYMKKTQKEMGANPLTHLKRKMTPFVLRRMKSDVLDELPPINEIIYHCELAPKQRELYTSYAQTARKELSALVQRDGFDKIRIHVLATLTRLKQICCHPAIFASDLESNESAKYDLLWQVIENLLLSKRKAVIFSQYTKMLALMKRDLDERAIPYCYLDGSTKNRMEMVKKFNETEEIPLFLVSLKAGGTGFNLTGADTVIHYDLWWNPAVEDQATDRVHRMGQKSRVSTYKFVTLGTIEEKIVELQNRKKGLVKQLVVDDEEAIEKLTWEEVLQLLAT